ncbi:MAG: bacterioferritin-associated ferredoxin [Pseudomonadota bacterium]
MYVCICNGITDKQIRRAVEDGAQSLQELREQLGVAGCCGQCANEASSFVPQHQPHIKAYSATTANGK